MTQTPNPPPKPIDILILGAGWTYQFLHPLLKTQDITHAATTRNGTTNPPTIPFTFSPTADPDNPSVQKPYTLLPLAHYILITFPLTSAQECRNLTSLYAETHPAVSEEVRWIQLGSTGRFTELGWNDDDSSSSSTLSIPGSEDDTPTPTALDSGKTPVQVQRTNNNRALAEDSLLTLLSSRACILDLAGLYGDSSRSPRSWLPRIIAGGKDSVRGKGAVHLIHGRDVARGVVGCLSKWEGVRGRRWIVTDLRCYDWWDLIMSWGEEEGEGRRWVVELMREGGVRALPREKEGLGRLLDGRGFWEAIGSWPAEGRVA